MSEKEVLAMLENALAVDEGTLALDTILDDMEEWDSLGKLLLITMAKKEFGKSMSSDEIKEFKTVKDILEALK